MKKIILFIGFILSSLISGVLYAQTLHINTLNPVRNALNIPNNFNIQTAFSANIPTPDNTKIKVMGSQTGFYTAGSFIGAGTNFITFDPALNFKAGETVTVEYLTTLIGAGSETFMSAYQYQFTVATTGTGNFITTDYSTSTIGKRFMMADMDKDGDIDMVIVDSNPANTASVWLNNGTGHYTLLGSYGLGTLVEPSGICLGDWDQDGDIDAAVPGYTNGKLVILRNNGAGALNTVSQDIALSGLFVNDCRTGDLDGDGDLDLVVNIPGNPNDSRIAIYLNDGSGSFALSNEYPIQSAWGIYNANPVEPFIADLDNDGDLDIVTSNFDGTYHNFSFFRNNGNAIFAISDETTVTVWNGGAGVFGSVWGVDGEDFDNDGDIDLVFTVITNNCRDVRFFSNDGNAVFSPHLLPDFVLAADAPYDVKIGDLDGDGDPDLVTSNAGANTLTYFRNDGAWNFTLQYLPATNNPLFLELADIDGDNDLDIVTTKDGIGAFSIYRNALPYQITNLNPVRNALNFATAGNIVTTFSTNMNTPFATTNFKVMGSQTGFYTAGSFAGNGTPTVTFDPALNFKAGETLTVEFLTTLFSANGSVLITAHQYQFTAKATGTGSFVSVNTYNTGLAPSQIAAGDIDGDGLVDIAFTNQNDGNVSIFRNTGGGNLAFVNTFSVAALPRGIVLADFDNDGDLDIGTANNNGIPSQQLSILRNNGAWSFALTNYSVGGGVSDIYSDPIHTADLNGDGYMDIVMYNDAFVRVLRNQGDGTFVLANNLGAVGVENRGVHLTDVDNDGNMDIIVANGANNSISIFKNNGNFTFDTRIDRPTTGAAFGIVAADFDADGFHDIATCNTSPTNQIAIFINSGGSFTTATYYSGFTNPASLSISDFDGDNDLDISITNNSGTAVSIMQNNGAGDFSAPLIQIPTGTSPSAITHADLDNDHDIDMVVINPSTNKISVLMNELPFVVVNTNDSGLGSLRQAITNANANPDFNTISFNIAGGGVKTINLTSPITISNPVFISGYSQTGSSPNTLPSILSGSNAVITIELNISNMGLVFNSANNSIVEGLAIYGGSSQTIDLQNSSSGNQIRGCFIGADATGIGGANNTNGIITNANAVSTAFNTIGGANPADRNVIVKSVFNGLGIYASTLIENNLIGFNKDMSNGGNGQRGILLANSATSKIIRNNAIGYNAQEGIDMDGQVAPIRIEANYIGTNGSAPTPNSIGVRFRNNTQFVSIGGLNSSEGNVISGNAGAGISIESSLYNAVLNNYIGTHANGTTAVANGGAGISLTSGSNFNTIGLPNSGNLISGNNSSYGVYMNGSNNNQIQANRIGLNSAGTNLSNGSHGIYVGVNSQNNLIGGTGNAAGNMIAFNTGAAIFFPVSGTNNQNAIRQNSIFCNSNKGINLNNDANNNTNKPAPFISVASPTWVSGTSQANDFVEVFFHTATCGYNSPQGSKFMTIVQADGLGDWSFTTAAGFLSVGEQLTATATSTSNNTSEFSAFQTVADAFVVVNTNDSGAGSLRQAIINANANPDFNTITFNIPPSDTNYIAATYWRITPNTLLPDISESVLIDGYSQAGAVPNSNPMGQAWNGSLKVQIAGNIMNNSILRLAANDIQIRGLNLAFSTSSALFVSASAQFVTIAGCLIGTNINGTGTQANHVGIEVLGNNKLIGGTAHADRNVISGNTGGNIYLNNANNCQIKGNYIGTNGAGNLGFFANYGIALNNTSNSILGGATVAESNVISGNGQGIFMQNSPNNQVKGNKIGTSIDGLSAIANTAAAIKIINAGSGSNLIGGNLAGEGNLIAGNSNIGIWLSGNAQNNTVAGNIIGIRGDFMTALPNNTGILIDAFANNNTIGFSSANLISGNMQYGISFDGAGNRNRIQGNLIGTNPTGSSAMPNGSHGIYINNNTDFVTITSNTIAYNLGSGIFMNDVLSTGNPISKNHIFCNNLKAIDLNSLANANKQPPFIALATLTTVKGTALSNDFVEVFFHTATCGYASPQGSKFITVVQADGLGNWNFTTAAGFLSVGEQLTATATNNLANNTSEFSSFQTVALPFVVINTNDSGAGSLRQAIINANADPDFSTISFDIPTSDPNFIAASYWRIRPVSPLPSITQALWIAGHSQTGASPNSNPFGQAWNGTLKIQIDGNNSLPFLLHIGSNNVVVRGLNLVGSAQSAINIGFGNQFVTVAGCLIGTNIDGTAVQGNIVGIELQGNNNLIGGLEDATRNIISGNTIGIRVSGLDNYIVQDYIGLAKTATTALPNQTGIEINSANGTQIRNNAISGNSSDGIKATNGHTNITNNYIGLALGSLPLGNGQNGISMTDGNGLVSSNTIAFNSGSGVFISSPNPNTVKISQNSIYGNGSIGIDLLGDASQIGITPNDPQDLDNSVNNLQNYPEFQTGAVAASLNDRLVVSYFVPTSTSLANYPLTVDFFLAGGNRQGKTLVHTDNYNALQAEKFVTIVFLPFASANIGDKLVATATDSNGNTSEFSTALPIDIACPITPQIIDFKTVDLRNCATARTFAVLTLAGGIQGNYSIDWQNDGFYDVSNLTLNTDNQLVTELSKGTFVSNIRIINFVQPFCPSNPYFTTAGLIDPRPSNPPTLQFVSVIDPTNCESSNGQILVRIADNIPENASFDVDLNGDGSFDFISVKPNENKELIFKDLKAGFRINFIKVRLNQIPTCEASTAVLNRILAFASVGSFDIPLSAENNSLDFEGSTNIIIENAQIGSAYRLVFGTAFSTADISFASEFVSATTNTLKIPTGKLLENTNLTVLVRSADACENFLTKTVSIAVANGIFQEQLDALQTLFNATGGSEWSKKWSFVKPYQLDGVVFDKGNILEIDISYRKVKDVLSAQVFKVMPKLKSLNVEGNQLTFKSLQSFVGTTFTFKYKNQESINEEQTFTTVEGATVQMAVEIEGKDLEYQWYKDGQILEGETFSTISFISVIPSQSGTYHATVKSKDLPELTILRKSIKMTVTNKPQTTDLAQLRDFYEQLGGKNWKNRWNLDDPNLANLFGLILKDGKIISLSLVNNNLQGELPAAIFGTEGFFAHVENLNFSGNPNLKGKLPESFKSLKNLKRLDLSGMRFDNLWEIVTEMPNLEVLILTDMNIKSIDLGIGNLKNLKILFLDKNRLTEIPSILGKLEKLQILNFAENDIEVLPDMFAGLKNLERLLLHKNKIRFMPKNLGLTSLFELTLSSNRLEELAEDLRSNKNLEFLDLSNNLLDFFDLEKILAKQGGRTEGELKVLYVPQSRFGTYQELTLGQGIAYRIPAQTTGNGNTYWWYQNGNVVRRLPAPFEGNYDIGSLSKTDAGTYYVAVTNPIAPDLTLYSLETKIMVTCATQTNAKIKLSGEAQFCEGEKVDRLMSIENLPAGNTVQWFRDGLRLFGATNLRLTSQEAGTYKVLITDSEGCSNFIKQEIRLEQLPTPKPEIDVDQADPTLLKVRNAEKYTNFQWFKDYAPISEAISATWKAQTLGTYQVRVTDSKGCQGISNVYAITPTATEQDFDNEEVRIYPNPANEILQIEIPLKFSKNYEISLWNAQGQEVQKLERHKVQNGRESLYVGNLPAGLYMLKVSLEGKEIWKKITVSR